MSNTYVLTIALFQMLSKIIFFHIINNYNVFFKFFKVKKIILNPIVLY